MAIIRDSETGEVSIRTNVPGFPTIDPANLLSYVIGRTPQGQELPRTPFYVGPHASYEDFVSAGFNPSHPQWEVLKGLLDPAAGFGGEQGLSGYYGAYVGGDVARRIASRNNTFSNLTNAAVLAGPFIATAGAAGAFGSGAGAAGAGTAGTEAASTFGAAGEFAGAGTTAGGATLAEQAASIGSGSLAGTTAGTGVGTGTVGAGTTAAGTTAATGTALSRILNGTATQDDYLQLAGQVGPSLISAFGSGKQADAFGDLANQYIALGAPYRDELSRISADPNAFFTSPTATNATESVLQRLSATHGNPAGSPFAQALTVDALYDQFGAERDRLARFGGLTTFNQAAPQSSQNAINARGTVFGDVGFGVGNVLNPPPKQMTLAELLRNARI